MKPIEGLEFDVSPDEKFKRQDAALKLPPGTTKAQLTVESGMKPDAVSKAGAEGWAQVMPKTRATLEERVGRALDPTNLDDALLMHREVMQENLRKFKTPDAAMKAYNGGWSPAKWDNPETSAYVPKIEAARAQILKVAAPASAIDGLEFDMQPVAQPAQPIALDMPAQKSNAPKVGYAGQSVLGVARGVTDAVDGGAYLLDKGLRTLGIDTTKANNAVNGALRGILPQGVADFIVAPGSVSQINAGKEAAYKDVVGDSGVATAGRVVGNIGTAIAGPGQAAMAGKAADLWKAGGAIKKLLSIGTAAGQGAIQGAVTNTRTDADSVGANATGGAIGGAVGQTILPVAKAALKGGMALAEPFYKGGIDKIAARTLDQFKTAPIDPKFSAAIPGFKPTLAQATQDPGIANLTRVLQSMSPQNAAPALEQRAASNNTALLDTLRSVAGDDIAKSAAQTARRAGTQPLYAQVEKSAAPVDTTRLVSVLDGLIAKNQGVREGIASPLSSVRDKLFEAKLLTERIAPTFDAVQAMARAPGRMSSADHNALILAAQLGRKLKNGTLSESDAMGTLLNLQPTSKRAAQVIEQFTESIGGAARGLTTKPSRLQDASKGIGDMIEATSGGAPVNTAAMRELKAAKRMLDTSISRASPEYGQAQAAYRELSKPVNAQEVAEALITKATGGNANPVTGDATLFAAKYGNLLKNPDQLLKNATGRKTLGALEDNITPDAAAKFGEVKKALDIIAGAEKSGAISGSRTAQIGAGQNLLNQTLGPLGLTSMSGIPAMGLVTRLLNAAAKSQDHIIHQRLTDVLMDPALINQLPQIKNASPQAIKAMQAMQRAIAGSGAVSLGGVGSDRQ